MRTTKATRGKLFEAMKLLDDCSTITLDVSPKFELRERDEINAAFEESMIRDEIITEFEESMIPLTVKRGALKLETALYAAAKAFVEEYERSKQDED